VSRSDVTLRTLFLCRGPVSVFSVLANYMDTPIRELSIETRCDLAIMQAQQPDCCRDLFLLALGRDSISRTAIIYRDQNGLTLLHAVAGAVGQLAVYGNSAFSTEEVQRRMLGWKSIIKELLAGGAELHATLSSSYLGFSFFDFECREMYGRITPLSMMLGSFLSGWLIRGNLTMDLEKVLTFYITTLYCSNVNLTEYGLKETLIWEPLEVHRWYITETENFSEYYFGRRRLLGFNYGPHPDDWRIWENEPTDEFVGDFWLMLDKKKEVMPGTWVE
jgi:hypothetical protein